MGFESPASSAAVTVRFTFLFEVLTMAGFVKAVRTQKKLRAAIDGPSGAGKTYSTLRLAFAMKAAGLCKRIAVVDTENNAASLYAGEAPDGEPWEFETLNLKQYNPDQFTNAIKLAAKEGFDCVIVDSLSHAWVGAGGALDLVDQKGGKFQAWKDVTPLHRAMIDAIIQSPIHVLVTMRSKTEYVMEKDANGSTTVRKIGVAPVQREGMEYEFDVYCSTDWSHQLKVTKTRCSLMDNATGIKPGPTFWEPLFGWLNSAGTAQPAPAPTPQRQTFSPPATVATSRPADEAPSDDQAGPPQESPPVDEDGPNNSPDVVCDNFAAGIAQATSHKDLRALSDEIASAARNGWITAEHHEQLKQLGKARWGELTPSKSEPARS